MERELFPSAKLQVRIWVAILVVVQFLYLDFTNSSTGAKYFFFLFAVSVSVIFFAQKSVLYLPKVFFLFAPLLFWLGLSVLWADPLSPALVGFFISVAYFLFVVLITSFARGCPDAQLLLVRGVMVAGVLGGVLGLFQYSNYLEFGAGRSMLIPYLLPPSRFRIPGVYGQANLFAHLLLLSLLAFGYCYLHHPADFRFRIGRLFRFLPVFVVSLAFFLTKSRSGLLALVAIGGVLLFLCWKRRYCAEPFRRKEFLWLCCTILLGSLTAKVISHGMFLDAFFPYVDHPDQNIWGGYDRSHSNYQRLLFMLVAVLIARDHPWLGVGLDNFKSYLAGYQMEAHRFLKVEYEDLGYTRWAHNEYLQLLCEGGVPVFLLLMAALFFFLRSFWKDVKAGEVDHERLYSHLFLFPMLIHGALEWPFRHPALAALFLAFLGILLSRSPGRVVPLGRLPRFFLQMLGCSTLVILCVWFSYEYRVVQLRENLSKGTDFASAREAFVALAKQPFFEYPILKSGLPAMVGRVIKEKDLETAEKILPLGERMVELEGAYWQWYNLSRLYAVLGRREDALKAIAQSLERNPGFELGWIWQRHLTREKVSEETGIPVEELLRRAKEDAERLKNGSVRH